MNKLNEDILKWGVGVMCAILSAILAFKGVEGWGWFLFIVFMIFC